MLRSMVHLLPVFICGCVVMAIRTNLLLAVLNRIDRDGQHHQFGRFIFHGFHLLSLATFTYTASQLNFCAEWALTLPSARQTSSLAFVRVLWSSSGLLESRCDVTRTQGAVSA